jgi:hypothetical protein
VHQITNWDHKGPNKRLIKAHSNIVEYRARHSGTEKFFNWQWRVKLDKSIQGGIRASHLWLSSNIAQVGAESWRNHTLQVELQEGFSDREQTGGL